VAKKPPHNASRGVGFRRGHPFNPYRMFTGVFIPEGLARCTWLSGGAKLAWGRLARYAGIDGRCHPTMKTLGEQIGVGERQAQKDVSELERKKLIRRVSRFSGRRQTSNAFEFLWHELFEEGVNDRSGEGVNDRSGAGANCHSPKESQSEESHIEESQNIDLDSPSTNRKKRDSRLDLGDAAPTCKKYPRLREALTDYMTTPDDSERVSPPDRLVVDVMDSSDGATEAEVIRCLQYLREERQLKPGSRYGPRHFSWFKTVVPEYFQKKRLRETVYAPVTSQGAHEARILSDEDFDSMTEAIEIDGGSQ
jgi:hypothetical protein